MVICPVCGVISQHGTVLVERQTHVVKVPSSNPTATLGARHKYPPKLHFRGGDSGMHCLHSSVNEMLILGCQYQLVLAGLLQH